MKPPLHQSPIANRKSAIPASDAARAMSDAMLSALLSTFNPQPSTLQQARTAFIAYCRAHPQFKDVRSAWASFHTELQKHMDGTATIPSVLSVAFPATETEHPVPILQTPAWIHQSIQPPSPHETPP